MGRRSPPLLSTVPSGLGPTPSSARALCLPHSVGVAHHCASGQNLQLAVKMALQAKSPEAPNSPKPERPTDSVILGGLEDQQGWAAEALYDAVAPTVRCTLLRVLQRREGDFEELARQSFEHIVRTIAERQFWVECSLTVWAAVISVRIAIAALRTREREQRELDSDALDSTLPESASRQAPTEPAATGRDSCKRRVAIDHLFQARTETLKMQRHLVTMQPDLAEIVFLHDAMGIDLDDLAHVLGLTGPAARLCLAHARRELLQLTAHPS